MIMETTEKILRQIDKEAEKAKREIKRTFEVSDLELKRILVDFAGKYRELMYQFETVKSSNTEDAETK